MITETKVVEGLDRKLRKLRDGRGLSQQELADRLETARSVISTYETGVSMPTYGKLIKLARIFDVSTDYLLGVDSESVLDLSCLSDGQSSSVRNIVDAMK